MPIDTAWEKVLKTVKPLEDYLSKMGFRDSAVLLATASYLGGQKILEKYETAAREQQIKDDGSTVGQLDLASGVVIAEYINASAMGKSIAFRSEERMPFRKVLATKAAGIFDDLDGSINPLVGGLNWRYIGTGGVVHAGFDDTQVSAAGYLPFDGPDDIFVADISKGTYRIKIGDKSFDNKKIILPAKPLAQKNIITESGFQSPNTLQAEAAFIDSGFYAAITKATKDITARDRITGGIFQTISGIRDRRQVTLNYAPSHQADFLALLLVGAGAEVIGQDGRPILSFTGSYAMLGISPDYNGDRAELKERFVEAMKSPRVGGEYKGWNPGKVFMKNVF